MTVKILIKLLNVCHLNIFFYLKLTKKKPYLRNADIYIYVFFFIFVCFIMAFFNFYFLAGCSDKRSFIKNGREKKFSRDNTSEMVCRYVALSKERSDV